jgi:hypothetical protein
MGSVCCIPTCMPGLAGQDQSHNGITHNTTVALRLEIDLMNPQRCQFEAGGPLWGKCHLIDRQWRCLRLLSRDSETARDVQRSARGSSQRTTGDLQRLVFSALYIRGRRTLAGEREQTRRMSLRLGSQSSPSSSDTNVRSILTLLAEAARLRNLKFRPRDNGSTSHRIPFSIPAALYFLRRLLISDIPQSHHLKCS